MLVYKRATINYLVDILIGKTYTQNKIGDAIMIIDSHTHIGKMLNFNMPGEMLLSSMENYGVAFSLTSTINCTETDHSQIPIPTEMQHSQYLSNKQAVDFAKASGGKVGVLLWIKPRFETCDDDFKSLYLKNKDVVYGLKMHPYHSKLPLDNKNVEKYLDFASEYRLPMLIHTATEECSKPQGVYNAAKKYPNINFVMGHLGLGSDNKQALSLLTQLPNLYGDTCWVDPQNIIDFINNGNEDKLMFGTDNTIDGKDTLSHPYYKYYFNDIKKKISPQAYEKLMWQNATKIYKLNNIEVGL